MSLSELKEMVDKATPEERLFLAHYLAHRRRTSDPERMAEISRRMSEMDAGKKISWADLKQRLQESNSNGRE
jgi:hypothetical protein